MSIDDINKEIRRIGLEARSGHNDGWVQNHHREQLKEIAKTLLEVLDK